MAIAVRTVSVRISERSVRSPTPHRLVNHTAKARGAGRSLPAAGRSAQPCGLSPSQERKPPIFVGQLFAVSLNRYIRRPIAWEIFAMCRNIRTLFNFDPPVTDEEVRAASLQFVRKITGFNKPSKTNEAAFLDAVEEVAGISRRLLHSMETTAPPKNREEEAAKAKARAAERFGD